MGSVYTVGQVNLYIKNMFSQDFALNNISIKGEVSNCKYHSSGHIYFSLKDSVGVISCVMFAGSAKTLAFKLEEGKSVVASGSVSVYERDGKYQLYCKNITLGGDGDLYKKFLELKEKLLTMGMFDPMYKKPIPKYSTKVGIITASTGAAIQDICNISQRRNPYTKLYLYNAIVQGSEAKQSLVDGIIKLDSLDLDVLIIGRGGGSIEDLWAFNEEEVARAIFNAKTPIISAVGHETDTTIADYVSDLRAPTPSAAAELAVFEYLEFERSLNEFNYQLKKRFNQKLDMAKNKISSYADSLKARSPKNVVNNKRMYLTEFLNRINEKMNVKLVSKKHELEMIASSLNALSPLNKLGKGYGFIEDKKNTPISSINKVKVGSDIKIRLKDGQMLATIKDIEKR